MEMAEASKKRQQAKELLKQIGEQLVAGESCPDENSIVKLLKKASGAFTELKPLDSAKHLVNPSGKSRTRQSLFAQRDKDATVLAPDPGFAHSVSSKIFRSLLRMFEELHDTSSKYFRVRIKILETVDTLDLCLVMLDTGCEDLVLKMFKCFFSVVREDHPQRLIDLMSSIVTTILAENVETDPVPLKNNKFQPLLDVILRNIIKEKKGAAFASYRLAASVIQSCTGKLKSCISQFLTSCILNRDAVGSPVKESYHEIILEIYQVAPELLLSVIPLLTHELLTDQVDVRIKVLNLIKKLLVLQGKSIAQEYPCVLKELLNRFIDKSAEVRLTALSSSKALYITNLSGRDSLETLFTAIGHRLLDHDDKVRIEAVNVVCELAKTNLTRMSSDLITQAAERLRDKKVFVRRKAFEKLVELYQEYCSKLAAGITFFNENIEEIPCKFLMLCFEKDCPEFSPQSMELELVDLFPACLSTEEKTKQWISIFSHFKPPHLKALKTILSQKRRLRDSLKHYLDLCRRTQDTDPGENERQIEALVVKMSSCFVDPIKTKGCFLKFKELGDDNVFSVFEQFLKENSADSGTIKDVYLEELAEHKALSEFFNLLFKKCAFNIFGFEHVRYIIDSLSSEDAEKKHLENCQVQLLLTIISAFPSLLKGSETKFQHLILEGGIPFNEQLIQMLAREGCNMPVKLSNLYPSLEKVCLEGPRSKSKLAVSAISALANADGSEQFIYPQLCKILVDSLQRGQNAPFVLQSLGCLAQYSVSTFESQEKVITKYIVERIFQQKAPASEDRETSTCCKACKMKVYGLKTIVRSFLPHKNARLARPFSFLLDIIREMLQNHQLSAGCIQCGQDEAFVQLAAAKSVLQLSRKWDLHISPDIFRLTISVAKDPSPVVRRSFTSKLHKLLLNHAVPIRYACTFCIAALDPLEDLRNNALKYLEEFIWEYGKRVQIHETMTKEGAATHPACLVVFLIHVLAHDHNFPAPDCRDVKIYAKFMSPLFVTVQSLVNGNFGDHHLHLKSYASLYLRSIFNALRKAEDAVDARITPKLRLLAEVGLSILKSLNTKITPLGHTPSLVLLPSSMFKNGSSEIEEVDPYSSIRCKADANFTKNLVSSLKSEIFLIGSTGTKHIHQLLENSVGPSPTDGYKETLLMEKTKEQAVALQTGQMEQFDTSCCESDTKGHQNLAIPSLVGTVVLDEADATRNRHKSDVCRVLEAIPSDNYGSMSKSSLPHDEPVVSCSRNEEATNTTDSIPAALSISSSTTSDKVNHFLLENIENNGGLASKRTCTPTEDCYFSDIEDSIDSTKVTHQDLYDPLAENCEKSRSSTANAEADNLDSFEEANLLKKRDLRTGKASRAGKRTKRLHDTIETGSSEVLDSSGNQFEKRRTRSQKA